MANALMHTRDDYSDMVMTTLSDDCEIICTSLLTTTASMTNVTTACRVQINTLGEHVSTQNQNNLLDEQSSKHPTPKHGSFQVLLKITDYI
ncbi:unnamed protein product [Macrosiphum euphorbiae]|uniref:Uncharacterized protein n=1 Tax=Macrosiphum euphorbiae TaxID=13131 RepID=A0AAV0XJ31_9HEMI|nr:unnamed protein product [Macrosiphum euphorbiae]